VEAVANLGVNLNTVLLWAAVIGMVYVIAYRKFVCSVVDPLNVFIISQVCSCVLAILVIHEPALLCQFFAAQAAFYVGFRLSRSRRSRSLCVDWSSGEIQIVETAIAVLFVGWVVANVYVGLTVGLPLFSGHASEAKVQTFREGLGFVKRLNGGAGLLVTAGSLILAILGTHRRVFAGIFVASLLVSTLDASKGSALLSVFLIGYALKKEGLVPELLKPRIRRATVALFVFACSIALYILSVDRGDLPAGVAGLFTRILFYGDVVLYYYQPDMMYYLKRLGPIDFLLSEINPMLGEFRLAPYQPPLGVLMVTHSLGNETLATLFGPNTQFFVRGHIYFGSVCGTLYAAAVGWVVGRVRRWFFETDGAKPFALISALTMAVRIFTLPVEEPYCIGLIFDTFLPIILIVAVLKIIRFSTTRSLSVRPFTVSSA
jgi:hypothetical protein